MKTFKEIKTLLESHAPESYTQGYTAAKNGKKKSDNPYDGSQTKLNTEKENFKHWNSGFEDGSK